MPNRNINNRGKDLVTAEIGDGNTNTVVGSGITQRDDSRDINQYFGTNPNPSTVKEDLAELLSLALFGNDRLDFKGVVAEVASLKKEISNLVTLIDSLQQTSKIRDQSMAELKSYVVQLEKDISDLKKKNNKWVDYAIYIFIAVGSISSIVTLILSVNH